MLIWLDTKQTVECCGSFSCSRERLRCTTIFLPDHNSYVNLQWSWFVGSADLIPNMMMIITVNHSNESSVSRLVVTARLFFQTKYISCITISSWSGQHVANSASRLWLLWLNKDLLEGFIMIDTPFIEAFFQLRRSLKLNVCLMWVLRHSRLVPILAVVVISQTQKLRSIELTLNPSPHIIHWMNIITNDYNIYSNCK